LNFAIVIITGVLTSGFVFYFTSSMSLAQKQLFAATRLQAYRVHWTQWVLDNDLFPGLGCREKDFEANSGGCSSRIFERFGT